MKYDILTFGSVTLDVLLKLQAGESITLSECRNEASMTLPLGDKIPIQDALMLCGGGASNSATGFTKLGFSTAAVGVIGDDVNSHFVLDILKQQQINTDYLITEPGQSCSLSVILSDWTGGRTVLHKRLISEHFTSAIIDGLPDSQAFYIGHLQQNANEILHALAAKYTDEERLIGWNPGKTQFQHGFDEYRDVFPLVDMLILNAEEARDFTGLPFDVLSVEEAKPEHYGEPVVGDYVTKPVTCITDVRRLADKFLQAGVEIVCITDGCRGAQIFDGKHHYWAPPIDVEVTDSLGAGDAFSVGLISAKLHGKDLATQILWGSLSSASVIQHYGAQAGQLLLDQMPA